VTDTTIQQRLQAGDPAPDFDVQLATGGTVQLADFPGRRLLLVFVRHLACLPCQEHLREIAGELLAITGSGAQVQVISFDSLEEVVSYAESLNLSFPVASDEARTAYHAFGLTSASLWHTWHPRTLWRYVKLLRQGRKLQRPQKGSDLLQLGADFVLDPNGVITYAHYSERPDDRPDIAEIVQAVATTES
jgi:peroxiredoxin